MQIEHCSNITRDKDVHLRENLEEVKNALPEQTKKAAKCAAEKGACSWLTVIPVKDVYFTLNKCACVDVFDVDHTIVCRCGGFIIQRHNELHDLEAGMLKMACNYIQIERVLQEINREVLTPSMNRAADAQLNIHAHGLWECQGSSFFDVRLCYPNADSYRGFTTK